MTTITAYKCDYCKRYGKDKGSILRHETKCYYNPVTMSCGTCTSLRGAGLNKCHSGVDISEGLKTVCDKWELHPDLVED